MWPFTQKPIPYSDKLKPWYEKWLQEVRKGKEKRVKPVFNPKERV